MSREYIVVKASSHEQLAYKVNRRISDGYEPIGGVAVGWTNISEAHFQAMLGPDPEILKAREQALVEAGLK